MKCRPLRLLTGREQRCAFLIRKKPCPATCFLLASNVGHGIAINEGPFFLGKREQMRQGCHVSVYCGPGARIVLRRNRLTGLSVDSRLPLRKTFRRASIARL